MSQIHFIRLSRIFIVYTIQVAYEGDIQMDYLGVELNLMLAVLKSLILLEFKRVLGGVVRSREIKRFIDWFNSL